MGVAKLLARPKMAVAVGNSVSVFSATPRWKLRFELFKAPLLRCLLEHLR
jgi:hypothetical protein